MSVVGLRFRIWKTLSDGAIIPGFRTTAKGGTLLKHVFSRLKTKASDDAVFNKDPERAMTTINDGFLGNATAKQSPAIKAVKWVC
jgi:hypothetical protein